MPSFDEELQALSGPSFDEELAGLGSSSSNDAGFRPWSGPSQIPMQLETRSRYMDPDRQDLWSRFIDTTGDALQGFAGGSFSGLGVNPGQMVDTLSPALGAGVRARQRLAQDRSPADFGAGKLIGETLPLEFLLGPELAANPIPAAGLQGALSRLGNADTNDWSERLGALTQGGASGLGFAIGFGRLGNAARSVADTVAPWLRRSGYINRAASAVDDVGRLGTPDEQAALGQWMESKGAHEGKGPLGFLPQSQTTVRKNVQGIADAARAQQQDVLAGADARGVLVSADPTIDALRALAASGERIPEAGAQSQASFARQQEGLMDDALATQPDRAGQLPFDRAWETRQAYDKGAGWRYGQSPEEGARAEINRDAANAMRGELQSSLDTQWPERGEQWREAQGDLSNSLDLLNPNNEPDTGLKAFAKNALRRAALPAIGGSAGLMFGGPMGALASAVGASVVQSRGASALAGAQGLGADVLSAGGAFARDSAGMAGRVGAIAASDVSRDTGREEAGEKARGHLLGQAALDSLHSGGRELGPYASQFAEAASSNDSNAVANLVTRLTMSDPEWRSRWLPNLQRMTMQEGY